MKNKIKFKQTVSFLPVIAVVGLLVGNISAQTVTWSKSTTTIRPSDAANVKVGSTTGTATEKFSVHNIATGVNNGVTFYNTDPNPMMKFYYAGQGVNEMDIFSGTYKKVSLYSGSSGGIQLFDNSNIETVRLSAGGNSYISGNFGIGTKTPGYKLDVQGGMLAVAPVISTTSPKPGVICVLPSGNGSWWNFGNWSNGTRFSIMQGDMRSATDNTSWINSYFTVTSAGNVGIGTTNPQSRLAVNGTITTTEIVVTTVGWADFVFKPDYKLPSLLEIEKHIKTNGTLPGIPNEKEVAEKGVGIGAMQVKLLQKVEELTLYMIDLKKENEQLKTEIAQLRN